MKKIPLPIFISIALASVQFACERPNSPDFKLEQKVHAPVLFEKSFPFLGSKGALLDTTSSNFDSLFSTDGDGLVILSKRETLDIGDLGKAIPQVNVTPVTVNSQVGELNLDDFSSQSDEGNLGSASFQQLTGAPPPAAGTPVPAGSSPASVNVDLDTDYFVSATVKGGELVFVFQNDLGIDLNGINLDLNSGSMLVNSGNTGFVADGTEGSATIVIPAGTLLQDLNIDVSVSWPSQQMKSNSNRLVIEEIAGNNLIASQIEAALDSQEFFSFGTVAVDNSEFEFAQPDDYIEIASGQLLIDQIVNQIDLDLDTLRISFPGIRAAPYDPQDSLVIRFEGADRILRSRSGLPQPQKNRDLSDLRIYAEGNTIDYFIRGVTEQTQGKVDSIRIVSETDGFTARVEINSLNIRKAVGVVKPKEVLINSDQGGDGSLDLFNDQEAEIIEIDALTDLSDQLDGIEFNNPTMSINYTSNIGVSSTIYAAIVGTDAAGNRVYLRGLAGGPYEAQPGEQPAAPMLSNGVALESEQMIKFAVSAAPDGQVISDAAVFAKSETNVDQFLNNLPSDIRIISVAKVNENSNPGTITAPVQFEPALSVDLPLNFSASSAIYTDTTEADLGDLPDPAQDDQQLTDASFHIRYENRLPLQAQLNLVMLDSLDQEVTRIPLPDDEPLIVGGAPVDSQTGFVSDSNIGSLVFAFDSGQLEILHNTRSMLIEVNFSTTNQNVVKVRATDSFSLQLSLKSAVETTFN